MLNKERADAGNISSTKTNFTSREIWVFSALENTPFERSTQCQRRAIRASNESPPTSKWRHVTPKPNVWVNHGTVYDALLVLLESEGLECDPTGTIFCGLDPSVRRLAAQQLGVSEAEIFRQDADTVRNLRRANAVSVRNVPRALWNLFEREGIENFIFENHIVEIPNRLHNRLICVELENIFGRSEVLKWPGFIEDVDDYDRPISLDLDSRLSHSGFMRPLFQQGRLDAFMVYRGPTDSGPFKLKSREVLS